MPLSGTRYVPTCRADALQAAGVGTAGVRTMQSSRSVVEISEYGDRLVIAIPRGKAIGCGCVCGCIIAKCYRRAVGKVRGPQVLPQPALGADLNGAVDVAVVVHHGTASAGVRPVGGETPLFPVGSAHIAGGVGTQIVGGAGRQTCDFAVEAACADAFGGVAVTHGRVLGGAPAKSSGGYRRTATGRHKPCAGSRGGVNVVEGYKRDDRQNSRAAVHARII